MIRFGKVALVLGLVLAGPARAMDEQLVGQWERVEGKSTIQLNFTSEGRLHIVVTGAENGKVHADFKVTRDGIAFGIITSAETNDKEKEDELTDQVFRFRYRIDEGMLIIRDSRASGEAKIECWVGCFKAVQTAPTRANASCCSPTVPIAPLLPATSVTPAYNPVPATSYKPRLPRR
jgi:hypothetical protein